MNGTGNEKIKSAFWGAVLGDALGTVFDGMSKGHIHAVFKNISSFVDPLPALKGKEDRWKKSGLYTAPSQMMFLFGIISPWRRKTDSRIPSIIAHASSSAAGPWGIFRHPDRLLQDFIERCRKESDSAFLSDGTVNGVIPPPIFLPLLTLPSSMRKDINRIAAEYARVFTTDEYAIAATVIAINIAMELVIEPIEFHDRADCIIEIARNTARWFGENSAELFALRINPESISVKAAICADAIALLSGCQSIDEAEVRICAHAKPHYPHNITRASINHPLLAFPFACAHFALARNLETSPIITAACEGGASGLLSSIAGIFSGASEGDSMLPAELRENLINKTAVQRLIDSIVDGRISQTELNSFIDSEASLTRKEQEELAARLRHVRQKNKPKPSRPKREEELTRHVVESWTKLDKAKWKKQKKRHQGE